MTIQSHKTGAAVVRALLGRAPRRRRLLPAAPMVGDARPIESAARLRFWRPPHFPRDDAALICGEGAVDELPLHTHEALRVMLPASRFVVLDGASGAVVVRPGQVHVAAPLELLGARRVDDAPCAMRIILVDPAALPRLRDEVAAPGSGGGERATLGLRQVVVDDASLYAELWALIGDLRGPIVAEACAPKLLWSVDRLLAGLSARQVHASPPPPTLRVARKAAGVGRVRDHLRAHVADNVSLDELARVAGLSKFYLLRAFRRAYGVTPHAYQMQLRLAHAWRYIAEGSPPSRASYDAGFADQSHLTRRFAAVFGVTPARYARQLAVPPGAVANSATPSAA